MVLRRPDGAPPNYNSLHDKRPSQLGRLLLTSERRATLVAETKTPTDSCLNKIAFASPPIVKVKNDSSCEPLRQLTPPLPSQLAAPGLTLKFGGPFCSPARLLARFYLSLACSNQTNSLVAFAKPNLFTVKLVPIIQQNVLGKLVVARPQLVATTTHKQPATQVGKLARR